MQRNGRASLKLRSRWGKVEVPAQVWRCPSCQRQVSTALDPGLDNSGWTPHALVVMLDLAARLPFAEASQVLDQFSIAISAAGLERVVQTYGEQHRLEVATRLSELAEAPLEPGEPGRAGRVMVVETDGVVVLGRNNAGPEDSEPARSQQNQSEGVESGEGRGCPGREVKVALVYPQSSPGARVMVADASGIDEFEPLVHGLLRQAGVRLTDTLVGVGDGAAWVARLLENLGAARVLDVYHATLYLETVLVALAWGETERAQERARWCRGAVNGLVRVRELDPGEAARSSWTPEAVQAWAYLEKQAGSGAMEYESFRAHGWPIGSGQVEGANKAVIGKRMKQSGMRWSRAGARRMASLRAQLHSRRPVLEFDDLRHRAFPPH